MEDWDLEPPRTDEEDLAGSRRQGLAVLYEEEDRRLEAAIEAGEQPVPLLDWMKGHAMIGQLRRE